MFRKILLVATLFGLMPALVAAAELEPNSYHLDPALDISLFAKEPEVVDPVALTWDEEGNMYVVEMRDYPYGFGPERKPGGTVRMLADRDSDGKIDRVTLFATDLSFPTSIAPWNGGVLIAAPPEIVFLKDTDGDGKADVREAAFKGFTLGVTDSNMNGLRWGLDNRVHGLNGGNGGNVTSPRKPGTSIMIRNLDFSFDPGTGDFTTTYHSSDGFGLVFDDWGRSFVTHNINHIQQRIILARYLNRFPGFPPIQAVESISDHGDMARIYPISEPETRVNHPEQSGHFSSAGGMGFIGFPDYAGDLFGSVLVCDVVGNLVHRDVLVSRGPVFAARRSSTDTNTEFFASRDRAFRPIGIELGPDGALYLIDMQRDVIEHPDYIPEQVRRNLKLRAGEDRGRIYRITPKGGLPSRKPGLRRASAEQLVEHLSDPNPWWRYAAQRLLVERRNEQGWVATAAPKLKESAKSGRGPLGRLHTLWTLHGLNALDEELILSALSAREPGLRENALVVSEPHLARSQKLRARALELADDPDTRVRFQAALTLGDVKGPEVEIALTRVLVRDHHYRWSRMAALSSVSQHEDNLFHSVLTNATLRTQATDSKHDLIREVADVVGARSGSESGRLGKVVAAIANVAMEENIQLAALEGLQKGLARRASKPTPDAEMESALEKLSRTGSPAIAAATWKLSRTLGLPENDARRSALANAMKQALDASRPVAARVEDIRLVALGSYSVVADTLFLLLDSRHPAELQIAALDGLRQFDRPEVANRLVERWRSVAPAVRPSVVNLLLQRLSFHPVLIEALEKGQLTLGELNLDLEQRRRLLWESTPEVRTRAARLIGDGEYANRKTVVDDWLKKLPASGNAARGRALFERSCAQCHALAGSGYAVGPDLGALAHRSVEDLLSNILDPNMAINPSYAGYTLETATGEIESGILQSETDDAVQLLQAFGKKVVVPRSRIKRLEASGLSLMPEGLESGVTPAELRDLIAFLQEKR